VEGPPLFVAGCDQKTQKKVDCRKGAGYGNECILVEKGRSFKDFHI